MSAYTAKQTGTPITSPDYQPHNVQVVELEAPMYPGLAFVVQDWDGHYCSPCCGTRAEAEQYAKARRGVIKAALKRRANKAKYAK